MRISRGLAYLAAASGVAAAIVGVWLYAVAAGWLGATEGPGEIRGSEIPARVVEARVAAQRSAWVGLDGLDRVDSVSGVNRVDGVGGIDVAPAPDKQILFGDLHVHTTFSFDAFLLGLPMLGGEGTHPPADACDFARYCSELDFYSLNDHAEYLTPDLWQKSVESVRHCNAIAGDPANPDLVSYLGWEWSQAATTPERHYGHKNVILLETGEGRVPTRPIAAPTPGFETRGGPFPTGAVTALALLNGDRGRDFARYLANAEAVSRCPDDVPVRELPADCREFADTPEMLFEKLDDWGFESLVIPHGTSWGIYTPAGSDWNKQLAGHDPARQRLVEVYSGHGNSEEYRDWRATAVAPDGTRSCPAPSQGYIPSCWRAGELIAEQCGAAGEGAEVCQARARVARQNYVDANNGGWNTAPGHGPDSWLDSGQCNDCFQAAFNHRPTASAQYMLAVRDFADPTAPRRFTFGFMASSDIHTAKPGSGYKEFWRGEMTEGRGTDPEMSPPSFLLPDPGEPVAESRRYDLASEEIRGMSFFENERANAFFYTGGLVAVHSAGRDRGAIFDALKRREVYGTSGPRILLWFDLLSQVGASLPMGTLTERNTTPRFRVRAVGSFEQKPGCPERAIANLGAERLEALCRGECFNPSDARRPISRIEVIRIRPQFVAGEALDDLIEDPFLVHTCAPDPAGCVFEFEDPEFINTARDAVYYVRAIEQESLAIHGGNPLGCRFDETGRCIEVEPCGVRVPKSEDCLSPTEQRAWSSPIFVDWAP
jgi:hypothetical protein